MPMIEVRDTRLYYDIAGDGDTVLLFIHGMCGGAWNWEDQMNRLSPEFTCVAYDRRGHSRSEPGIEDQSNRTQVDDAAALIEALGLDRPIVVGSSSGASTAIELLQRYPGHARAAVLAEPPLLNLKPGVAEEMASLLGPVVQSAVEQGGPRAAVDAMIGTVCSQFWSQTDEQTRERARDNAPLLFATLESEPATITADELAGIEHPVLSVTGADSVPLHLTIARMMVEHLPNARSVEVKGSGHLIHCEKPEEFAEAVRSFAREVAGSVTATSRS